MTYTPINWQTGDTITAEKLNRCDNGWEVDSTQLFSETVTTVDDGGVNYGSLAYALLIDAPLITVTFDGTDYTCSNSDGGYGAQWSETLQGYDFSTYPFNITSWSDPSGAVGNDLVTDTAGSHTISVSITDLQVSANFAKVVSATIGGAFYPLVIGTTTWSQVVDAMAAGKLVLRTWANAYDGGTALSTQYAGIELVTDAYVDARAEYTVSAIVIAKGVQSVTHYSAFTLDGALS